GAFARRLLVHASLAEAVLVTHVREIELAFIRIGFRIEPQLAFRNLVVGVVMAEIAELLVDILADPGAVDEKRRQSVAGTGALNSRFARLSVGFLLSRHRSLPEQRQRPDSCTRLCSGT